MVLVKSQFNLLTSLFYEAEKVVFFRKWISIYVDVVASIERELIAGKV